jgi:hypothetical protein
MEGFESEIKRKDVFFDKEKSPLESEVEEFNVPFLSPENLRKVFSLYELKVQFTEQMSDSEIFSFMKKTHDFENSLMKKAKTGDLMYGDNVIEVEDLRKFALYCILIGENFENTMWLDFDDNPIEKFMLENYQIT